MKSGVYKIQNVNTGRLYIGSSKDIFYRMRKHKERLRIGSHVNPALQNGWNTHGAEDFKFEPMIICETKDLLFYEQLLMDGYKSYEKSFGYNIRKIAESNLGMIKDHSVYIAGDKYNRLTLISLHHRKDIKQKWLCRCDCGKEKIVDVTAVRSGIIKSCGCWLSDSLQDKIKNKPGDKYNMFTLISLHEKLKGTDGFIKNMWLVRCDCGIEKVLDISLVKKHTKSCGCLKKIKAQNKSNAVFVKINGELLNIKNASVKLGIHNTSIRQRSKKFSESYQQACDHFAAKRK